MARNHARSTQRSCPMPKMTKPLLAKLAKLEAVKEFETQNIYAAAAPRNDVRFKTAANGEPCHSHLLRRRRARSRNISPGHDQPRARLSLRLVRLLHAKLALTSVNTFVKQGRFGALSFCPRATARRQSRPVPHVWRVVCARPRGATLAAANSGLRGSGKPLCVIRSQALHKSSFGGYRSKKAVRLLRKSRENLPLKCSRR